MTKQWATRRGIIGWALMTLWTVAGCEGTQRAFGSADGPLEPSASSGDTPEEGNGLSGDGGLGNGSDPGVPGAAPQVLGQACVIDEECGSGFCVDGFCCESACDEVCSRCSEAGQCQIAEDDPQCPGALGSGSCSGDAGCEPLPLCDGGADCAAICPGCSIEGECVAAETVHPSNLCLICSPELDPRGWSPNDDALCDDGLFCTVNDACREGACVGEQRICEDGVACNGISICDEAADSCSPNVNECGTNDVCDVSSGSCVSTCAGCLINDVCLPSGAEAAGNPCFVCDPAQSRSSFTTALGKTCGSGPSACSGQSTCDSAGRCQPNHLPPNTPCGSATSDACNQPDSCDGNGACLPRLANNGSPCDEGRFCTVGDQCQGGQCVATGNLNCGSNRSCDEGTNTCRCDGCSIGNSCFAFGAVNPANPCQICDPARSVSSFSVNVGATCGAGPSECSAQDTCSAQGQCIANDRANGASCGGAPGATCRDGECRAPSDLLGPCDADADCARGECLNSICALEILSIRVLGTEVPGGASPQNFMDGWFTSDSSGRNLVRVSTIPPGLRMYLGLDMTSRLSSPLPPNSYLVLTSAESSNPLTRTFQFNLSDGRAIVKTVESGSSANIVLSPSEGDLFNQFEWTGADVNVLSKTY